MKLLALLAFCCGQAVGIKCGRPLTRACLGETDVRYDPESSNNVGDQASIWTRSAGLYRGVGQLRVNRLDPFNAPVPSVPDATTISITYTTYYNYTVFGSRTATHAVRFLDGVPPPLNVVQSSAFSTSSHEKDGTMLTLPSFSFANTSTVELDTLSGERLNYPVDENTVYLTSLDQETKEFFSATDVCLDSNCDQIQESVQSYRPINGTTRRVVALEITFQRAASAEEWHAALLADYEARNVSEKDRFPSLSDPCSVGRCPTEAQWCTQDPNCSESPYQEPPASVKPGVIAGFVVAGVVLLVAVLYAIHRYLVAQQAQRYRTAFAKRIADTINVQGSVRSLSPEALANEFKQIDSKVQDGKLSKDELWEFISSGKAGEMEQRDFDALFAAMDLDKSGSVDFLEFCAFMGKCHDEYENARAGESRVVARRSIVAQSASRHRLQGAEEESKSSLEGKGDA